MTGLRSSLVSLALLAAACTSPGTTTTDSPTATADPGTSSTTGTSTTTSTTTAPTTTGPATSTGATTATADSGSFALMPDLPPPAPCDPWNDTCPRGQKCQPYALPRGAGCVDVVDDPLPVGEPCDAGGTVDLCEAGAMCVSPDGHCLPLCGGAPNPGETTCADACSPCLIRDNGAYGYCPLPCDPRASDCGGDRWCAIYTYEPRFFCASFFKGSVPAGMPCSKSSDCQEGSACFAKPFLPACDGDNCCTPVCDLNGPDTCDASFPGTVCNPWPDIFPEFNPTCVPDGLGLCSVPA